MSNILLMHQERLSMCMLFAFENQKTTIFDRMRIPYFILFFYLSLGSILAQNEVDSLKKVLKQLEKSPKLDTNYINTLNQLAARYLFIQVDSSILLARKAIENLVNIKHEREEVEVYRTLAYAYSLSGNTEQAIKNYEHALQLAKKITYLMGEGRIYNNLATLYKNQGNYVRSLEYHFKALKIRKKINDKSGVGVSYGNIAILYKNQNKLEKSLAYSFKAKKIFEEVNNPLHIAHSLQNIGSIYILQKKYSKAETYYIKALAYFQKENNKMGIAYSLSDLGDIYLKTNRQKKALEYFEESIKLSNDINDKYSMLINLKGIGTYYLKEKNYLHSIDYLEQALDVAKEIKRKAEIRDVYALLVECHQAIKNYEKALDYHINYKAYADSIFNKEVEENITQLQEAYKYEQKENNLKAKQAQQNALHHQKIRQQRNYLFIISIGLLITLILSIGLYRSRYKLQNAYLELKLANSKIKEKSDEIIALNDTLNQKVEERTRTLALANQKLSQYAFSNSHTVRRPLANILGLVDIIVSGTHSEEELSVWLTYLRESAQELDAVIHQINDSLQDLENESE